MAVTITEEVFANGVMPIRKIKFAWTSDASGDATGTTTKSYTGELLRLITVPDGTSAPTDDYDITITDEDGVDVLIGQGANRDTANTEQVIASSLGCVANDKLTLTVANAGNAKKGTVYLYVR